MNAATNFVGSSYAAAILFAADSAKAERAAAKMAAAFHDDIPFATTSDEGVAAHYGVKPPALVVFRAKPQGRYSSSPSSPPCLVLPLRDVRTSFAMLALISFVLGSSS